MEQSTLEMVFDAKRIGGLLGVETPDRPAPSPARPDERIIFLPPSVKSPTVLRGTRALMWNQDWYDNRQYTAKPGYWGVVLPVPQSNRQTHDRQDRQILDELSGYERTPMLVDTLLLSIGLMTAYEDFLKGDWVRCPEVSSSGCHVGLCVNSGYVHVDDISRDNDPNGGVFVWSSAARWIS